MYVSMNIFIYKICIQRIFTKAPRDGQLSRQHNTDASWCSRERVIL